MDLALFERLKDEVERVFRKKVLSYSDCLQLSEEIISKTGQRLNVNTLRRCFGVVASPFKPSSSTLNVLSVYCGFTSFDHFSRHHNNEGQRVEQSHVLAEYLSFMVQKVPFRDPNDMTYVANIRNTIVFLERYPEAIDSFQRGIAKSRAGQELYFEQFINVDQLNTYYGKGLRYYLAENKTPGAQIFAHALLIWRYWLTEDGIELQNHYKALRGLPPCPSMSPSVAGRYFQGQLLGCEYLDKPLAGKMAEARSWFDENVEAKKTLPFFEVFLANALLLAKQPEEALFYVEKGKSRWKAMGKGFYNTEIFYAFYLFEAIAHAMLGNNRQASELLDSLNKSKFYFLAVQYHTILILVTMGKLGRLNGKTEELDFLIKQTGFRRLRRLFEV